MAKRFYNLETKTYGLQNETRQYLRRLYSYGRELTGTDIADIDDFVKGLKQLGLWGNIVCWPMRNIHNIGTGSTVLSLGGGGFYNGTILNSGVWDNVGIIRTTASGNLLSTSIKYIDVAPMGFGGISKCDTDPGNSSAYIWTGGANVDGRQFSISTTGSITQPSLNTYVGTWSHDSVSSGQFGGTVSIGRTDRHYYSIRLTSGTTGRFSINSVARAQATATYNFNNYSPLFTKFGLYYDIKLNSSHSFLYLSNSLITDSQDLSLYRLLKTTICKNISLP